MANYDTGQDILENVLSRADELEIGAAEREEEAKTYIQAAYISVLTEGYPWPFARKSPPGVLVTNKKRDATITFTQGLATATITSIDTTDSMAGRWVWADGEEVVYRIIGHVTPSTTITLDSVYLGTSGSHTCHIFKDEYDLASDFLKPLSHKFLVPGDGHSPIELIGADELSGRASGMITWSGTDSPRYCAFVADKKIRIWPWTTEAKRFTYRYIYHPGVLTFDGEAATDTPIIQPAEDRVVISLLAVGNLLVDKNDDRASIFLDAAISKINSMKRLHQAKSRARIWVMPGNNVSTSR